MNIRSVVKLEELAIFVACIVAFSSLDYAWWWFPALLLVPDVSMSGYLIGRRAGAIAYNVFHHRALALAIGGLGLSAAIPELQAVGLVLMAHVSMDRIFGYGLKTFKGFEYTHLGPIARSPGESAGNVQQPVQG